MLRLELGSWPSSSLGASMAFSSTPVKCSSRPVMINQRRKKKETFDAQALQYTSAHAMMNRSGFSSGNTGTVAMAVVQVPMVGLGVLLMDKAGRRPLLMVTRWQRIHSWNLTARTMNCDQWCLCCTVPDLCSWDMPGLPASWSVVLVQGLIFFFSSSWYWSPHRKKVGRY